MVEFYFLLFDIDGYEFEGTNIYRLFFLTIKRGEKIQNSSAHPLFKNVAVFFSRLKNI